MLYVYNKKHNYIAMLNQIRNQIIFIAGCNNLNIIQTKLI